MKAYTLANETGIQWAGLPDLYRKLLLPAAATLLAGYLQWLWWAQLAPLAWILFYPAVFLGAWLGGLTGGLLSTVLALLIGSYFFIEPSYAFVPANPRNSYGVAVFAVMGSLFGLLFEWLHRTTTEQATACRLNLDNSRKRLTQALYATGAGFWEWNLRTDAFEWSENLWRLYGPDSGSRPADYTAWLAAVHADDREPLDTAIKRAAAELKPLHLEWRPAVEADGRPRRLMLHAQPVRDPRHRTTVYRGIVVDISEQLQTIAALEESEARYRALFEANPHPMWVWDRETGTFLAANSAATRHYGYATEEFAALETRTLLAGDEVQAAGCGPEIRRHRCKDGRNILVEMTSRPVSFAGRQAELVLAQDVTQRLHAEQQLRKLSMAIEQSPESVLITNLAGNIEYVNETFLRNSGFRRDEVLNRKVSILKSGLTPPETYDSLWKTLSAGEVWKGEFVNRHKDGNEYVDFAVITPIRDNQGRLSHYVAVQEDITEKKRMRDELEQYRHHLEELVEKRTAELALIKSEAEAANAAKSTFLSNMSHEIRTPMNAVLGLCYLLQQRPLDEESQILVRKINGAGRSLLAIINDILDFSKIEAGRLEVEIAPFSLLELLDQLADMMSVAAEHKKLELLIIPPLDADALIGDGARLKQVLVNLLSNAIKFTECGEVQLQVRVAIEQDDLLQLRFAVRDTGIGIAQEHLKVLFQPFNQADNSISRRFGGTGLGLAISRQLVELMGGELHVASTLGTGSEFSFVLPLQRDRQAGPSVKLGDLRLLAVGERGSVRDSLLQTARSLGWQADEADAGQAAFIRIIERNAQLKPYDIILIDWQPGTDGIATVQSIRQVLADVQCSAGHKPVVLLATSHTLKDVQPQALAEHANALLFKPLTPSALYNAVCGVLWQSETANAAGIAENRPTNESRLNGVRILVVDDSDINREVALRILKNEGAEVGLAGDGREALDWLAHHPDAVDIVLMDVQMPHLDGYQATRQIRLNPDWAGLPVVALTAGAFKSLQDEALAAGMDDFIAKPFDVEQLLETILHWTSLHPRARSAAPVSSGNAAASVSGIDTDTILRNWRQLDVYQTFFARFLREYAHVDANILVTSENDGRQAATALTHKLKGAAGALGLTAVATRCAELENALAGATALQEPAARLRIAIEAAAEDIQAWLPAATTKKTTATPQVARNECPALTERLLAALQVNRPAAAEQPLAALEANLGTERLADIRARLEEFDFRTAETLAEKLRFEIQPTNG